MAPVKQVLAVFAFVVPNVAPLDAIKLNAKMRASSTTPAVVVTDTQSNSNILFGRSIKGNYYKKVGDTQVPKVLFQLTEAIRQREFSENEGGIFRTTELTDGEVNAVTKIHSVNDMNEHLDNNANSLARVLKRWLRDLKEPLIPIAVRTQYDKLDRREMNAWEIIQTLEMTPAMLASLVFLIEFLNYVAGHQAVTRMGSVGIASMIAPNVIRGAGDDQLDPLALLQYTVRDNKFVESLMNDANPAIDNENHNSFKTVKDMEVLPTPRAKTDVIVIDNELVDMTAVNEPTVVHQTEPQAQPGANIGDRRSSVARRFSSFLYYLNTGFGRSSSVDTSGQKRARGPRRSWYSQGRSSKSQTHHPTADAQLATGTTPPTAVMTHRNELLFASASPAYAKVKLEFDTVPATAALGVNDDGSLGSTESLSSSSSGEGVNSSAPASEAFLDDVPGIASSASSEERGSTTSIANDAHADAAAIVEELTLTPLGEKMLREIKEREHKSLNSTSEPLRIGYVEDRKVVETPYEASQKLAVTRGNGDEGDQWLVQAHARPRGLVQAEVSKWQAQAKK